MWFIVHSFIGLITNKQLHKDKANERKLQGIHLNFDHSCQLLHNHLFIDSKKIKTQNNKKYRNRLDLINHLNMIKTKFITQIKLNVETFWTYNYLNMKA